MNKLIAQKIASFTIELVENGSKLVESSTTYGSKDELINLNIMIGKILGEAIIATRPIFEMYPDLLPLELKNNDSTINLCQLKPY